MSNVIEKRAIEIAMRYERDSGRNPKDVSRQGTGYDLKSGNRCIEIKGIGDKLTFVYFNQYNFKALQENQNYWLYVVYNIKNNKPKLIPLKASEVLKGIKLSANWVIPRGKMDSNNAIEIKTKQQRT